MKVTYRKNDKIVSIEITEKQVQRLFNACLRLNNGLKDAQYDIHDATDLITDPICSKCHRHDCVTC